MLSAVQLPADIGRDTARGQYTHGWQGEEEVVGYLEEQGVAKGSTTETYAAVKLLVDTRRWAGVPFYLRTGKRLGKRVTEIAVVFKRAPHLPFDDTATEELGQNAIVIRVQPDEGITMRFGSKVPGNQMEVRDVTMDFGYGSAFTESSPEAYERLILDVLLGDPPLFPRHEEVELSWQILDPIEAWWAKHGRPEPYAAGGWGPASAHEMMAREGRTWRIPESPATFSRPLAILAGAPMIIDLPKTTSSSVSKKLVQLRNDVGAMTLGRVLTLVIVVDDHQAEEIIEAANDASDSTPAGSWWSSRGNRRGAARMDAQIRLGGDAGASEVVIMRLYGDAGQARRSPWSCRCCWPTPPWWRGGRTSSPTDLRTTRSPRWRSGGSPTPRSRATRARR